MLAPLVSGAMNDKTARANKASLTPSPAAMYSASEVDSETTRCVLLVWLTTVFYNDSIDLHRNTYA